MSAVVRGMSGRAKRWLAYAAAALLATGCAPAESGLRVVVRAPADVGAVALDGTIAQGAITEPFDLARRSGRPLSFPSIFFVETGTRTGDVTLTVRARDGGGAVVASGTLSAALEPGSVTTVEIELAAGPGYRTACPPVAAELVVNTTLDENDADPLAGDDDLSLREALAVVEDTGLATRITFDAVAFERATDEIVVGDTGVTGGLPNLVVPGTCIDAGGLRVVVSGGLLTGTEDGLVIDAAGVTVIGLTLVDFPDTGITVRAADAAVIGCQIGVDGEALRGNVWEGILVEGQSAQIGPGNVVGSNSEGIVVVGAGSGTHVFANFVGLAGDVDAGQAMAGIVVRDGATDVVLGGEWGGNLIGFNGGQAISVSGEGTGPVTIAGNVVGTDAGFVDEYPNGEEGISVTSGVKDVTIGPWNVIANSTWEGIYVAGVGTTNVHVRAN